MHGTIKIIAEAGVNHNGSFELAKKLVEVAALCGADVVKFQTFNAQKLVASHAPKAQYQLEMTDHNELQLEMLRRLELNASDHKLLLEYCKVKNIEFLSSPFDLESVDFLVNDLSLKRIKIPSGEITNAPLLLHVAHYKQKVILSTGMSTSDEIESALEVLAFGFLGNDKKPSRKEFIKAYESREGRHLLNEKVILLHCTTEYPAPFDEVNLRAMQTISTTFGLPIGLSDHTKGIAVAIAAAALGAVVIEKHFTLDKNLPGPDHKASLEPEELKMMIQSIEEVLRALGTSKKAPTPSELKNKSIARRCLVAAIPIKEGEIFHEGNIAVKRPDQGVSPFEYWNLLGKKARKDYQTDEAIRL